MNKIAALVTLIISLLIGIFTFFVFSSQYSDFSMGVKLGFSIIMFISTFITLAIFAWVIVWAIALMEKFKS